MKDQSNEMLKKAMEFFCQISDIQKNARGGKWYWEAFVPGPISYQEMRVITEIAGCWCYDPAVEKVKFYTNQNHTNWAYL